MKKLISLAVLTMMVIGAAFAKDVNEESIYSMASNKIEQEVRMRGYYTELPINSSQANILLIVEQPNTSRAWSNGRMTSYDMVWVITSPRLCNKLKYQKKYLANFF